MKANISGGRGTRRNENISPGARNLDDSVGRVASRCDKEATRSWWLAESGTRMMVLQEHPWGGPAMGGNVL